MVRDDGGSAIRNEMRAALRNQNRCRSRGLALPGMESGDAAGKSWAQTRRRVTAVEARHESEARELRQRLSPQERQIAIMYRELREQEHDAAKCGPGTRLQRRSSSRDTTKS